MWVRYGVSIFLDGARRVCQTMAMIYHAALFGEPGFQRFRAHRTEPVTVPSLFTFEGPDLQTDEDLNAYFAQQFLPLQVVYFHEGREQQSHEKGEFFEAEMLMGVLVNSPGGPAKAAIKTRDGRTLAERTRSEVEANA